LRETIIKSLTELFAIKIEFCLSILGLIGNICNIIVFIQLKFFRNVRRRLDKQITDPFKKTNATRYAISKLIQTIFRSFSSLNYAVEYSFFN